MRRSPRDRGCGALTAMTGWLVLTQAEAWALWDPRVFITDCDAAETLGLTHARSHCSLSTITGSTRAARAPGITQAAKATPLSNTTTAAKVGRSFAATP